jgi:hypothetical protein
MGIKAAVSKPIAKYLVNSRARKYQDPVKLQNEVFKGLIKSATKTAFGADHSFSDSWGHVEFSQAVPLREYEAFRPYIDQILNGEQNVLWPGKPLYLCKTSGTTSGLKYIPLTRESLPNHIGSARMALMSYIAETNKSGFVDGKMIFLQGSPVLEPHEKSGIPFGRLSGIVANHVPAYLLKNRMPSYDVNCIEDWETKVDAIVKQTLKEDMRLISGIPSWVQMYFEKLIAESGKSSIKNIFPNFSLFVYGGVNFEPYRQRFEKLIGGAVPSLELYPASEGFIAYQNSQQDDGLLLVLDEGIFYEFIEASEYLSSDAKRRSIADVKIGVNYVIVLSTNAGLWSYVIGDTIKFTSLDPPKIRVSGRISHYTSAFGEHVIAEEVERALVKALASFPNQILEFTVAPQIQPESGLPYHEWFIEFGSEPVDLSGFAKAIDEDMQKQNAYYKDLIKGHVLQHLKISQVKPGAFNEYMKSVGRLGGQNKVPRLSNDRKIADFLSNLIVA